MAHPFELADFPLPAEFRLLATGESAAGRGRPTEPVSRALLDGFARFEVSEPGLDEVESIVRSHFPGMDEDRIEWALERWHSFRELALAEVDAPLLGPRAVIQLLQLVEGGLDEQEAVLVALVHRFQDEPTLFEAARLQWSFESP